MDLADFFQSNRNSYEQSDNSQTHRSQCSNFMQVPDAPTLFDPDLLSTQRCLSDLQASQLYQSSQKPRSRQQWVLPVRNNDTYSSSSMKTNPVKDILSTQLYRCTPAEKIKQAVVEVPDDGPSDIDDLADFGISQKSLYGDDMIRGSRIGSEKKSFQRNGENSDQGKRGPGPGTLKRGMPLARSLFPSKQKKVVENSPTVQRPKDVQTPGRKPLFKNSSTSHLEKDSMDTPMPLVLPTSHGIKLRPLEEIPERYRSVFEFPYFNIVQSRVFDEVFYTDKPLVVCAPTGAGKTAIFELAIVRLLMRMENHPRRNFKVVYMAPIKALCSEKYTDWREKFSDHGLRCCELTGDTEIEDYYELQEVNIILTTPEKWDSMTRRWRDNTAFVQSVCLFCIDEIHVLNDNTRGATMEAVISRMKTIQAAMGRSSVENLLPHLRFVAVSATIPNIVDIAEWLGESEKAVHIKMDDSLRPVRLRKVVLGFYFDESKGSAFHFDMSLNYKLAGIINTYSENKPTLVFCSTRKSTQQAGEVIAKDSRGSFIKSTQQRQKLMKTANMVKDNKLRDLVMKGIGFHHAGMDLQDRKHMEELFAGGDLPVLVATSTLAMGVNLPAHLVILKSTQYYNMGCHEEYSDTQILQMIGRAGRPQFDTTATAVIMTKNQTKAKYEDLLNGTQVIESSLHKNLVEHLNAEIVLNTINDISIAMEWIRYTFLYIRVMKNPKHYGMPLGLDKEQVERRLQDLCMKNLNELESTKMITMNDETFDVKPTEAGKLMARYCIAFETMRKFCKISGTESVNDMVNLVADCEEFTEIQLRTNEKRTLNTLNKDKNRMTIRFPLQGKIKTKQMKVNVLIQAALGSLTVQDFSLQQDTTRIFRAANRVSRCLLELLWLKQDFQALLSSVELCKSLKARLWEDSKYVTKQLDGIGPTLSNALVNAGITSFQKIEETNPRELELIVNRHPPFGNQIRDAVAGLPKYELTIEQVAKYNDSSAELWLQLNISNKEQLQEKKTASPNHSCVLLIGDEDNKIVYQRKVMDAYLIKDGGITKKLEIKRADRGPDLFINLISQEWVGIDVQSVYTPFYNGPKKISSTSNYQQEAHLPKRQNGQHQLVQNQSVVDGPPPPMRVPCGHSCMNKRLCGHDCCRNGVLHKPATQTTKPPTKDLKMKSQRTDTFNNYMSDLKSKLSHFPDTPRKHRLKASGDIRDIDLSKFAYNPKSTSMSLAPTTPKTPSRSRMANKNYVTPKVQDIEQMFHDGHEEDFDDVYFADEDWGNMNLGDDFIDETCDDNFSCSKSLNSKGKKTVSFESDRNQIVGQQQCFTDEQVGEKEQGSCVSENGDNSEMDMDWSDLNMYHRKRKEVVEDHEYDLPDLDLDESGIKNRGPSSMQRPDSNTNLVKTPCYSYPSDRRVETSSNSRELRNMSDELPTLHGRLASFRQPLTPHRYGQVVAWNKSNDNSPENQWSGSDNEISVADQENSSSALFNRSKEILNQHVQNISAKQWNRSNNRQQATLKEFRKPEVAVNEFTKPQAAVNKFRKPHNNFITRQDAFSMAPRNIPDVKEKINQQVKNPMSEITNGSMNPFQDRQLNQEHKSSSRNSINCLNEDKENTQSVCLPRFGAQTQQNTFNMPDRVLKIGPRTQQTNYEQDDGSNPQPSFIDKSITQKPMSNFFALTANPEETSSTQANQIDNFNSIFDGIF